MNPTRPALCYHTAILRRLGDKMKLLKFLCLPKGHRRARSVARSEIGPIEGEGGADLAVLRPTESAPDLRIGTSTLPKPSPLIHRNQESDGMPTILSRTNRLNVTFLRNTDPETVSNRAPPFPGSDQSSLPGPSGRVVDSRATSKNKSDWKSTTYAATRLAINLVKESSDVFPPLKSVAGGLLAILNHCEVRPASPRLCRL